MNYVYMRVCIYIYIYIHIHTYIHTARALRGPQARRGEARASAAEGPVRSPANAEYRVLCNTANNDDIDNANNETTTTTTTNDNNNNDDTNNNSHA